MTREELKRRTDVQSAYLAGEPIQFRFLNDYDRKWEDTETPGFDWDHCDYRVRPKPWRAADGDQYYYIDEALRVREDTERHFGMDDGHYRVGNYFKTSGESLGGR